MKDYLQAIATVIAILIFALGSSYIAHSSPPTKLVATYEQHLAQDTSDPKLWRFARYEQPLAASLRVYADGLRLTQGVHYTFGKDTGGWYVKVLSTQPELVVVDFEE